MGDKKYTRNNSSNDHNAHDNKIMQSHFGQFQIENPSDQASSWESQIWPPRTQDLANCKEKIINCYAAGTSTRVMTTTTKIWMDLI